MDDIEFIMINDGSTDRTMEILCEEIKDDGRFRAISMENHGYGYVCNYGMKCAKGKYIAIYEPDDTIKNDFYSTLKSYAFKFPHADIIRYNGFCTNKEGEIHRLYKWEKKYTHHILDKYQMKRFWRSHPSIYNGLYRAEFIRVKNIVFCESPGASFQDVTFMISLFYSNPSIYIIDDVKYYYTIHDMQSINSVCAKIDNIIMNWNDEYKWIKEKGINDYSFFLYKVCMQAYSICKKINDNKIRYKIFTALNNIFNFKFSSCNIATFKQKCICIMVFIRSFIYQGASDGTL